MLKGTAHLVMFRKLRKPTREYKEYSKCSAMNLLKAIFRGRKAKLGVILYVCSLVYLLRFYVKPVTKLVIGESSPTAVYVSGR